MTTKPPSPSPIEQPMHITKQSDNQPATDVPKHKSEEHHGLLQSRGAVLSFVFLVAGVVGLPLLWMNPNFSRNERVLWTVLIVMYSITLLILAGGIVFWVYQAIFGV